jgi:hypothetical protein
LKDASSFNFLTDSAACCVHKVLVTLNVLSVIWLIIIIPSPPPANDVRGVYWIQRVRPSVVCVLFSGYILD